MYAFTPDVSEPYVPSRGLRAALSRLLPPELQYRYSTVTVQLQYSYSTAQHSTAQHLSVILLLHSDVAIKLHFYYLWWHILKHPSIFIKFRWFRCIFKDDWRRCLVLFSVTFLSCCYTFENGFVLWPEKFPWLENTFCNDTHVLFVEPV